MSEHVSNFQILEQELEHYSAEDYLTDEPYKFLQGKANNNVVRYIQLLKVLITDAERKGVAREAVLDKSNSTHLWLNKKWPHNFLFRIVYEAQLPGVDGKVRVLPLMCGTGKSAAISLIMSERINAHIAYQNPENSSNMSDPKKPQLTEENGLLVVTDDIERMRGYLEPRKQRHYAQDLIDHPEFVTIMTRENIGHTSQTCFHAPILVMTTQRYFRLSMEEIEKYLQWEHGRRGLVIFDEQPMLLQNIQISNTSLNTVSSVLADKIPPAGLENEKDWCLEQWRSTAQRITDTLHGLEQKQWTRDRRHPNAHCYYTFNEDEQHFTADETRFMRFVEQQKSLLGESYWTILATRKLLQEGAVYCSTRLRDRYENLFGVVLDHRSKITDISSNVIVFDGTGDLVPDYHDDHFQIDHILGKDYRRDLSNMKVVFIEHNTSKVSMLGDDQQAEMEGMIKYLKNSWGDENGAIFTYQQEEGHLRRIVESKNLQGQFLIQHFGAIRGSNNYRTYRKLAQIGLFNRTPFDYLCLSLHLDQGALYRLQTLHEDNGNIWLNTYMEESTLYRRNKAAYLLADTEQNMFRGAIRNPDYFEPYSYFIFCNHASGDDMHALLSERYPEVCIIWENTPLEVKLAQIRQRNCSTPSHAQKILAYYDQLEEGAEFSSAELIALLGGNKNVLKECRRSSPPIAEFLRTIRIGTTHRFRKSESLWF